ncbi:MAG TPA: hypothetical protein P5294_05470 [Smithellaceae bacterium]|nr:hypothetical protein [Smithellaceae bacterium]HRS89143.1 hypothetical protein [Smithellaceae bacterium]HRV25963.1 hypothetical protein [Smithellaceae bacterium]
MKILKVLLMGMVILLASVYFSGVLVTAASENKLNKQTTAGQVKSKLDCKMTEEKDKEGKTVYKLTGKDCDKVANQVNSEQGQKATCCVCERTSYGVIVCRGNCCLAKVSSAFR